MLLSNFYYLITLLSLSTTVTCSEEKMISRKLRNSVVVIGSGAAGLASAIEASNAGSMVYLLEKMSNVGGTQRRLLQDTMRTAAGRALEPLVDKLTLESADAIEFLISLGLPLTDLIQLGGHSSKRTHRLSTHAPIGFSLVKLLHSHAAQRDNIQILTSTTVTSLLWEQIGTERRITGITYRSDGADEDTTLPAEAVVLASGGSAFDQSEDGLMSEFAPHVRGMATSSGSQADGSGIKLAREVGVDLINMDKVQVHPTGFVDPQNPSQMSKILAPEALRGSGGILVNRQGQRFANELGSRGYLSQSIFNHSSAHSVLLESGREQITAYMILNTEAVEAFGPSAIAFYVKRGLVKEFSNLDSLCADLGLPRDELLNTLQKYVASAESGTTDEFGKSVYPTSAFLSDNKLYVAEITPVVHYTLGGVMIDSSASAQWKDSNGDSQTFAGLFAAGESTGGVHGSDRLAGNSLLECIVFGRTAGRNAALVEKRASNNAKEDL